MAKRKLLWYGRTNSGKTALIGELAEFERKTTGKNTRLYTADRGGIETVRPYVHLGIIDAHILGVGEYKDSDPWIFLHNAALGRVKKGGKWVEGDNSNIGMFAFESMRSFAELLMSSMATKAGQGVNIGGGSNISFDITAEGEKLKVSGSNQSHFGVAQSRMTEEVWQSQLLPCDYLVWTSSVSKDEDTTSSGKILGPDVIGKALTAETPRWFDLTFRLDVIPAQQGKPERHLLYLGSHADVGAGNAAGLGNIRMPLDAPKLEKTIIEPASIVQALQLLEGGSEKAADVIAKRLGINGLVKDVIKSRLDEQNKSS